MGENPEEIIEAFWKSCWDHIPAENRNASFRCWSFGDNPELADELLALVLSGVKTATCGALWDYEYDGEEPPVLGSYHILTDFAGDPRCLIQLTYVECCPFKNVTAGFAAAEGEGDQSLENWREGHRQFFTRRAAETGNIFNENTVLVLERFKVVHLGVN